MAKKDLPKLIGYKKAHLVVNGRIRGPCIVTLEIPEGARRIIRDKNTLVNRRKWMGWGTGVEIVRDSDHDNKCRAECVLVTAIHHLNGKPVNTKGRTVYAVSDHNAETCCHLRGVYFIGVETYPDWYDGDVNVVCSAGIHFFMKKSEALNWVI